MYVGWVSKRGEGRPGIVGLLVVWFANGLIWGPLTTQLPVYVDAVLHQPPILTATVQTVQMACGAAAAILGGMLADLVGIKRTLILGFGVAVAAALQFFATAPALLLLLAVLAGAAYGWQSVASQAYLLAALRGRGLGIGAAAFFLGNTFASSLGNWGAGRALDGFGFGPVMAVFLVAICLLTLGAALLLPPVARPRRAEPIGGVLAGYLRMLSRRDVQLLAGVRYLTTCYWGAVTLLLPLLMFRLTGSKAAAGTYAAVSLAVAAASTIVTGRLSDRIGRRGPALALTLLIAADAFCLARFSNGVTGLFVFGVIGAAAAWSLSTLVPGLIDEVAGTDEKGRAVGLMHAVWSLAMLSGSLIGGALIEAGTALPFVVVGLATVAAGVMMVGLLRHRPSFI
jgi:MFS family permease